MESLYIKNSTALIYFSKNYYNSNEELLASKDYETFLSYYLDYLKEENYSLYSRIKDDKLSNLLKYSKLLCVLEVKEIDENPELLLELTESIYLYWRNLQRFSVVYSKNNEGLLTNFMNADEKYNEMVISFYRTIQEKLQGHKNHVYRQLRSGTDGSLLTSKGYAFKGEYTVLNKVQTITSIMLRTPMIIHLDYNTRKGIFKKINKNPITYINDKNFMCYPCLVGNALTYIYFHKDFTHSAVGLANLFEFHEANRKPDCIIMFGVEDNKNEQVYYYDEKNDMFVGKLSYNPEIEYFGYFKKMALTLANARAIKENKLPIHGAMVNLYYKDGSKKGIVLMGDSGAGKSETINTLNKLSDDILHQEVVFDDMGAMFINDKGDIVCNGTETGAFVRLNDLDAATAYKDMDRSIFFNPEGNNARVIMPVATHDLITKEHKVDIFLYANNYENKDGLMLMDPNEAKEIYKQGKRYAIGTTGEKGISSTYFANPFGPMQDQKTAGKLIDKIFKQIAKKNIKVGELYTHLSLKDKEDGLYKAAKALITLTK